MLVGSIGCAQREDAPATEPAAIEAPAAANAADAAEDRAAVHASLADVESALGRLPGLIGSIRVDMRRHLNSDHVAAAQRNGVGPVRDSVHVRALVRSGRLVRLADSTHWWVVRELDHSLPYVTPGTERTLEEIGRRFHARLHERGLPPLRFDITSLLRTSQQQAQLRRRNPNAADATSSHEFGTTVDIAYLSFLAPAAVEYSPRQRAHAITALDSLATQYANHLEGELGAVLQEMLREGIVIPLRERGQPVFHITVARDAT